VSKKNLDLGAQGEAAAISLLEDNGYKIIARNYRTKFGEIDIIAFDKETICFVEVKTRKSLRFGLGQEAISAIKQRHIGRVALLYLKENNFFQRKARFDVVSVIYREGTPQLTLIRSAFELDRRYSY
jgi:putative endonuclease